MAGKATTTMLCETTTHPPLSLVGLDASSHVQSGSPKRCSLSAMMKADAPSIMAAIRAFVVNEHPPRSTRRTNGAAFVQSGWAEYEVHP